MRDAGGAMDQSRAMTFGDSGLDRAAWMRGQGDLMARHLAEGRAAVLPLWRGKPLFRGAAAVWLAPGHPLLAGDDGLSVFLGLQDGQALFARDLSAWQPPADAALPGTGFFDPTEQRHPDLPEDHAFAELRARMTADRRARRRTGGHRQGASGLAPQPPLLFGLRGGVGTGRGRLAAALPGLRHQPFPAHRSGGDHAGDARQPRCCWAARRAGPRGCIRCSRGSWNRARRSRRRCAAKWPRKPASRSGAVRYLASQPWPFPASLMLGCDAEATSEAITLDPVELEDGALGHARGDGHGLCRQPPARSARRARAPSPRFCCRTGLRTGSIDGERRDTGREDGMKLSTRRTSRRRSTGSLPP